MFFLKHKMECTHNKVLIKDISYTKFITVEVTIYLSMSFELKEHVGQEL